MTDPLESATKIIINSHKNIQKNLTHTLLNSFGTNSSSKAIIYSVKYDDDRGLIEFRGEKIQISGEKQLKICNLVLKDQYSMKKKWELEEILETIGERPENLDKSELQKFKGEIYRAARRINSKVSQKTTFAQFFINKPMGTLLLNPKIIEKIVA